MTIAPIAVTVEVDATDCPILANALAAAKQFDACPDHRLVNALKATLEACAVLATTDIPCNNQPPKGAGPGTGV